jgi:hypothetical protein
MSKQLLTALAVAGCGFSIAVHAENEPAKASTTVGSEAFIDATHITNQSNGTDVVPSGTGFDVKRLYLYADHTFNDVWSADITLDAQFTTATTGVFTTPTGTATALTNQNSSGGATEVFIKKLYLQAKIDDALIIHGGSYTSPWAAYSESLWGYRWVEKVTTDRLGFANTADWGLNAGGKFGDTGVSYSFSIVDGGGFKNPTRTKSPDYEARVSYEPFKGASIGVGGYAGHLGQVTVANEGFQKHWATRLDIAAGYTIAGFRVGLEGFQAKDYKTIAIAPGAGGALPTGVFGTSAVVAATAAGAVPDDKAQGGSGWVSYAFLQQYSVFARYDFTRLSQKSYLGLPSAKDKYATIGVAYKPIKNVDLGLVYKDERVTNGSNSLSGADANGSVVIGGNNISTSGHYSEIGLFAHWVY